MANIIYNASDCPAVQTVTGLLSVAQAGILPGGNAPVSDSIVTGQMVWTDALRRNATRSDLAARYGGGGACCVLYGLDLSPGIALSVLVAAGHGNAGGIVENSAAQSHLLSANSKNYVWLLQDGTVNVTGLPTDPLPKPAIYLGCCLTGGAGIVLIDYSGVLVSAGGVLRRDTADAGAPTDTPPATVQFLARTAGGRYWYDGSVYIPLPSAVGAALSAASTDTGSTARAILALLMEHLLLAFGEQAVPASVQELLLSEDALSAFVISGTLTEAATEGALRLGASL